jgi:hypothetical protein
VAQEDNESDLMQNMSLLTSYTTKLAGAFQLLKHINIGGLNYAEVEPRCNTLGEVQSTNNNTGS